MHCLWIKPTSFKSQRAETKKPGIYTQVIHNLQSLISLDILWEEAAIPASTFKTLLSTFLE